MSIRSLADSAPAENPTAITAQQAAGLWLIPLHRRAYGDKVPRGTWDITWVRADRILTVTPFRGDIDGSVIGAVVEVDSAQRVFAREMPEEVLALAADVLGVSRG